MPGQPRTLQEVTDETCSYTRYPETQFNPKEMCCTCGGGLLWTTDIEEYCVDRRGQLTIKIGFFLATIEVVGQILFYASYKGSLKYAENLIEIGEESESSVFNQFNADDAFGF